MAEQPALNRFYVASYAANDKDFPILAVRLDPRVAGYRVPEDLSPHPDSKRYPNHVFTGSQPSNGDERVTHIYEILPSPYVPFTRYDDDLGPIQGRRRSVKNEGQQADLASDKKISYEGREGSAIVSNEIEETWSIAVDEDGNSLFPVKDRDFYDPSRGAVQERRQLFVPTGEEEGTLENVNGVITQTSYEPYNEFLSVKIVQTYKVDGPQLIGRATDNDGQLVTVTTQRKGADGYIPPNPTATRTVEVSREDAESLIERIVDTPEIFTAQTFQVERPDPIPQKFRVAVPIRSSEAVVAGQAQVPSLSSGQISITEEQRNKFLKRISTTSRDQASLPKTLIQKSTDNDRQTVTITETLRSGDTSEAPTATTTISSEALGDGNFVVTKTQVPEVFAGKVFQKTKDDLTPQKFRGAQESNTIEENLAGIATSPSLNSGEFAKSEQQVNKFVKRVSTTSRAITKSVTLLEKVLTPEGQIGTRTLSLASGDQEFVPSALLIDANVENLGDGRTVKTETTIPNVFSGTTIRKTKTDLTPEKFKAQQEDTITEETVAGEIDPEISLSEGEFAKSEQQVTEFVKRTSVTTRDIAASTELTEFVITSQGQLAERKLRLSKEAQTIQPDALLIDGSIEELGDGRTIKTEVKVPVVFDQKTLSKQQATQVPSKFINQETEEESFVEGKQEAIPETLGIDGFGVIQATAQRLTDFTVRQSKTIRNGETLVVENQSNNNLQKVTVTSEVTASPNPDPLSATTEFSRTQAIGGGKYIKETGTVEKLFDGKVLAATKPDTIPEKFRVNAPNKRTEEVVAQSEANQPSLGTNEYSKSEQRLTEFTVQKTTVERDDVFNEIQSQRLEENWGINIPFKEYISSFIPSGETFEGEGLNDKQHIVREYNAAQLNSILSNFSVKIPTSVDLDLPRILRSIRVEWQEERSTSFSEFDGTGLQGVFRSLTQQDDGEVSSTLSLVPRIEIELEDVWGKNIPATMHMFFLKKELLNILNIRNKVSANSVWPVFKPKSFSTTVYGKSETKSLRAYISRSIQTSAELGVGYQPTKGSKEASSASLIPVSINIPPCLRGAIGISEERELVANTKKIELNYEAILANGTVFPSPNIVRDLDHKIKSEAKFIVPETVIKDVPRKGIYLINSSAEPYKFGWFLVRATTINASVFA
jgi:hypothetical protein